MQDNGRVCLAAVLVTGDELEIRAERENGEVCSYKAQL